jgi:acylphosphatase
MSTVTVRFVVKGNVQGVGFRRYVQLHAQRMALRGYVVNLDDGAVECVAQGASDAVNELETLLRIGPRFSSVEDVECTDLEPGRTYGSFRTL